MANQNGKTLIESAYDSIRVDIIRGQLEPEAKLRIEELRQRYDTGASPLREALNRLAGDQGQSLLLADASDHVPVVLELDI